MTIKTIEIHNIEDNPITDSTEKAISNALLLSFGNYTYINKDGEKIKVILI